MMTRAAWFVVLLAGCDIDDRRPRAGAGADAGTTPAGAASTADAGPRSECTGCNIAGSCIANGSRDPGNPCRVCDPERDAADYSVDVGASCGSPASECSGQDTCDGDGRCVADDVADGVSCGEAGSGLFCLGGECSECGSAADPDGLCASRSPATPLCDRTRGRCAACLPATCGEAEPVCEPDAGCRACEGHADCPSSACHLSGPSQGACFAAAEVVQVGDASTLRTQIAILAPSAPRALRLAATTFSFDELLSIGAEGTELAIIGQPGTVLTGGPTDGAPPFLSVGFDSILYIAGLTIADGPVNAINSSSGSILWLDDVTISGYPNTGVSGTSEGHIRRSRIEAGSTAVRWQGGSLAMENTSLGPGAGTGLATVGSPSLDVRYITIAGNTTSLSCDASPGPSGIIRNSLLAGTSDPAVSGTACGLLTYQGNAVDQAGFGELIGHYQAAWFTAPESGDFHLTAAGASAIGATATWAPGDPELDIDDSPRPSDRAGSPGIDEP